MMSKDERIIFIPDGTARAKALARTTHLCIAAHQDDIEFMAFAPISECYQSADKFFCGVVTTDGAGSPRSGRYKNLSDDEMKAIRIEEQKKAASIGGYGSLVMLGYPSARVKDKDDADVVRDYIELLETTRPRYVYVHNLADKHETHVATAVKAIKALRAAGHKPEKVYGCEVWRDLDWLNDGEKVLLDCGARAPLALALASVFDSQIAGGKRYDLAIDGRRRANATFGQSHSCDRYTALNYAMDLTPLALDKSLDIAEYVTGYIDRFKASVDATLKKLS